MNSRKKIIHVLLTSLTLLLNQNLIGQQTERIELPEEIKNAIINRIDKGYHLGTIVGIINGEELKYFGFGRVSLSNDSTPNENSIFEIGSITKTFTASLIADLHIKGKIDINQSIEEWIPILRSNKHRAFREINALKLVTHTSGLPREPSNIDKNKDDRYKNYNSKELEEFLLRYKPNNRVKEFNYSNLGVLLLEHGIETKMNFQYESMLQSNILNLLGMKNTFFHVPKNQEYLVVRGFRNGKETKSLNLGNYQSMGGIRSTASDMLKYLKAQFTSSSNRHLDSLLSFTQQEFYTRGNFTMGFGWEILQNKKTGKKLYYHKGGTNSFVSFAGFDPENKKGVVVLISGRGWFSDLGFKLLDNSIPLNIPE